MNRFSLIAIFAFCALCLSAQPAPAPGSHPAPAGADLMQGLNPSALQSSLMLQVNPMTPERRDLVNRYAAGYRSHGGRSVLGNLGASMLSGGVAAVVNVLGTEIINLTQIRSRQKKEWMQMRQRECTFVDSLRSVRGQRDFYARQSSFGPLDPSDMNFDGFTFSANRAGHEVLRMVCHLDTSRLDHLFLHSKFYLVVDTIVFHPYRSFLPNMSANRIHAPQPGRDKPEQVEYWNTISQFDFSEVQNPALSIRMDVYSSWINELVQVHDNVRLGSFTVNIPVSENALTDSVYVYSRADALAAGRAPVEVEGDCFVVPRSYMPVSADNPSWGTGEYRLNVVFSQTGRYNPSAERAKHWHRDYKQLVKLQRGSNVDADYWRDIVTTFRDNRNAILKATYTPVLNLGVSTLGSVLPGTPAAGSSAAAAAKGGAPGAGGAAPQPGAMPR